MIYAGAVDLDKGLFQQGVVDEVTDMVNTTWGDWIQERKKAQEIALEILRNNTDNHHNEHMATDTGLRTEYAVGSYVLKRYPPSTFGSGKPSKQHTNLTGPYKVHSVCKSVYTLLDEKRNKYLEPCNVHLLCPYHYDKTRTNPLEIRLKDSNDLYLIEKIIRHVGQLNNKSNIKFEVKWVGYEDTTLEPWSGLCDNVILHNYLKSINEYKHIPKRFRIIQSEQC
jgi:hypothetical protein